MKHDMEQLLQQTLSPEQEPDFWLNRNILQKVEEAEKMKRQNKRRIPAAAAVAAAVLMFGSVGVFAAWNYLTPGQVAEKFEDKGLSAAFDGEGAIRINETQEYGGYRITLLGIVSGKNLSQYMIQDEQGILEDRSYIVTAIENTDQTPRPMVSDDAYGEDPFCVSPLIGGLNPWDFNVVTMNGAYTENIIDGIQYRIVECDNVEMFADRGLYLSVNDGNFFERNAYQMDPETGEITRNEAYEGVNALFRLPVDTSKADPAAAEAYIRDLYAHLNGTDTQTEGSPEEPSPYAAREAELSRWTAQDFAAKAELLESRVLTPENGSVDCEYSIGEDAYALILSESMFEEDESGFCYHSVAEQDSGCAYVETLTDNGDGTYTFQLWRCPDEAATLSPAT